MTYYQLLKQARDLWANAKHNEQGCYYIMITTDVPHKSFGLCWTLKDLAIVNNVFMKHILELPNTKWSKYSAYHWSLTKQGARARVRFLEKLMAKYKHTRVLP